MREKQTAVRLPEVLVAQITAASRVKGVSVNSLVIEALEVFIQNLGKNKAFQDSVKKILNDDMAVLASFVEENGASRKPKKA
jgi:hypothetical protein